MGRKKKLKKRGRKKTKVLSAKTIAQNTIKVDSEIFLTSNINILKSIVKGNGPKKSLFALGYAGWLAGQLEDELSNNGWLIAPGNSELIFECKAEKKWREAIKSIGINPDFLSSNSGKC